jgi:hypothetical protein
MPRWLIVAGLVGLSGCALLDLPPPAPYADSGWRSLAGAPLSIAEVEALRLSCVPRQLTLALDPGRPVANPIADNPVYHPGGEALANAPALGIAAPDRPAEPGTRRVADPTAGSLDECLARKGLVRMH